MTPAGSIRSAFGLEGDLWALFYKAPVALRLELGGDWSNIDQPVPRVTQALSRARAVCDALFPVDTPLTAVIATPSEPQEPVFEPLTEALEPDAFAALRRLGFGAETSEPVFEAMGEGDDAVGYLWRTADLSGDLIQRDVLLWAAITLETPVHPKAPALTWLADFRRGVMVHVYDDRGIDVVATDRAALRFAYERFGDWLLDHDRARMDADFGS